MPDDVKTDSAEESSQTQPDPALSTENSAGTAPVETPNAPALPSDFEQRLTGLQARATRAEQARQKAEKEVAELRATQAATSPFVESLMTDEDKATASKARDQALREAEQQQQLRVAAVALLQESIGELIDAGAMEPDIDLLASLKAGDGEGAFERLQELQKDLDYTDGNTFAKSVKKAAQKARETKLTQPFQAQLDELKAQLKEANDQIAALEADGRRVVHVGGGGSSRVFSREDVENMSLEEWKQNKEVILEKMTRR